MGVIGIEELEAVSLERLVKSLLGIDRFNAQLTEPSVQLIQEHRSFRPEITVVDGLLVRYREKYEPDAHSFEYIVKSLDRIDPDLKSLRRDGTIGLRSLIEKETLSFHGNASGDWLPYPADCSPQELEHSALVEAVQNDRRRLESRDLLNGVVDFGEEIIIGLERCLLRFGKVENIPFDAGEYDNIRRFFLKKPVL